MRSDELWQKDGVQKAQSILSYYLNADAKCSFTSSGEKYDSVPNHQAVTDLNADSKSLRIGEASDYCLYCNLVFHNMIKHHYNTEAKYLKDHYCRGKRLDTTQELIRLGYNPATRHVFQSLLPRSLKAFSDSKQCPHDIFKALLDYLNEHSKKHV